MGILAQDLTPLNSGFPTALTPVSKDQSAKFFKITRTDTAQVVRAVLPADATITGIRIYGSTVSNAATTATATITVTNNSGTVSTGTVDVKTNGATTDFVQMSNLPNIQPVPLAGDLQVKIQYAETGTASSSGGPWVCMLEYVR